MPAVVATITPPSLPVGPPADTTLYVIGDGFEPDSQIRFGPVLERTDHYGPTKLSTVITGGLFPNPDPAVPVSVFNPSDGSESNAVTFAFVAVPPMPPDGSVVADLGTLKMYIGARTNADDNVLNIVLFQATEYAYERVYPHHRGHPDVQGAILLQASRWYKRRQSPEGVAGFGAEGVVVPVSRFDPDLESLLERHYDYAVGAGIA